MAYGPGGDPGPPWFSKSSAQSVCENAKDAERNKTVTAEAILNMVLISCGTLPCVYRSRAVTEST